MAFGIPYARYRESRTFQLTEAEIHAAVEAAFQELHWRYRVEWGTEYKAWIPATNWSWHQDFTLKVKPNGVLEAESKSAYYELMIDLGRNGRNVNLFFAVFKAAVMEAQQTPHD